MNNSASPLISVIIPTYNQARYLGKAIQSVLNQTYSSWEIIVIDNYSIDNTEKVVASFSDQRITYIKTHNCGVIASSRNLGMNVARGDWFAFLDSDDLWYQEKLEIVIKAIRDNVSIDVICTDELLVNLTTGLKTRLYYGPYNNNFYRELLLKGNRLSTSSTLVKRKFMIKHGIFFRENQEFVTVEDYDFWMLLAKAGAKFKFIKSIQGECTIHGANASGQYERHRQSLINVLKDHVYNQQSFNIKKDKLWAFINAGLLISSARNMLATKSYGLCFINLIRAFLTSPPGLLSYVFYKTKIQLKKTLYAKL
jgi:glycosyltransferase involved in cell wall biosynthesis